MLARRRVEKKLTRKVMMVQTIEAEHRFKVKQSKWLGVWAEHNHRTTRRRTGLSWLEYTVVTRLSICHCDQWERLSRLSPSRASPLSNCWRVANVGIPVWSGTSPLRSTRHHCCYCRAHCCDCRLIVGLSLRAEVGFTEPNPRYYQLLADSFQEN